VTQQSVVSLEQSSTSEPAQAGRRDLASAIGRGARGLCPNCGKGAIFIGFLQVRPACEACGEAFHHHRADDAPAYLTILVVGHLMLPIVLGVEEVFAPALWIHLLLWGTLIPAACLALLRPLKGMIVGLQWASRMHGFGEGRAGTDA
jgi:uncharacterized protein (DUF983 family)